MIIALIIISFLLVSCSAKVDFQNQPVNMEVILGKTTERFDCVLIASDISELKVGWIHTDLKMIEREYTVDEITQKNERYHIVGDPSIGDFSLLVSNTTESDAGSFRCRVRQADGVVVKSSKGILTILFPPADGYPKCNFNSENDVTLLNCMVNSQASLVDITWTRSGETSPIAEVLKSRELSTSFTLTNNDNGVAYQCRIRGNSVDSDRFCNITPMNQPPIAEFRFGLTHTSTKIGGNVTLKCDGKGKPYVSKLRWYYGNRLIEKTSGKFKLSMDKTMLEISGMTEMDHDKQVTCEVSIPSGLATNVTRYINIYKVVTIKPQSIPPATQKISGDKSLIILVTSSVVAICILLLIILAMSYEKFKRLSHARTAYPINSGLFLGMQNNSPRSSTLQSYQRHSFANDLGMLEESAKIATLPNQSGGFQTVICYQSGPDSPAICYPVSAPVSEKATDSPYFKNTAKHKKSASFSCEKQQRDLKCKAHNNSVQCSSMHSLNNVYDTISSGKKAHDRTGSIYPHNNCLLLLFWKMFYRIMLFMVTSYYNFEVISGTINVEFVEDPSMVNTIKAVYGTVAYIPCIVTSKEIPYSVRWFHDGSEVFAFHDDIRVGIRKDRYSFPSGLQNGNFTLKINDIRREDNGTFYCIVSYKIGSGKSSGHGRLQVYIPPDDDYPHCSLLYNNDGSPKPGDSVKLSCITRGEDPLIQLSWSDADAIVIHHEITNNLIKAVSLRKEDNGKPYTCSASGLAVDPPRTCTVTPLMVSPTVAFKLAKTDVYEGENIQLECHGQGLPVITDYKWYYDGQFVGQSFERFQLSEDKTRLVVSYITLSDKGKYVTCRVSVASGLASNVSEVIQVREIVTSKPNLPLTPIEEDNSLLIIIGASLGFVILILILVIVQLCYRKVRDRRQLHLQYQDSMYEEMNDSRCDRNSFDKLSMGSLGGISHISGNQYLFHINSRPGSPLENRRHSCHSITPPLRNSFSPSRASSPYLDRRSFKSSRSNTPPETPNKTGSPASAYLSPRTASESPFFPRKSSVRRSPSPQPISPANGVEPPFLRSLHDHIVADPAVPSKRVMEIKASEGIPLNQVASSMKNECCGSMPHLMEKAVEQTYEEMPLTRKVRDWRTTSF
ncbi:uncharacterized protein LOC117120841 [Anneissia japonica]|uniref:uncharacterized protein LOC117120841 n=1 Tax=Anneissia japonica TaxID=1529436 RepID=UPI001425B71F|nr:uncharacterized protein LOC117120841 [Anneissia japonica]